MSKRNNTRTTEAQAEAAVAAIAAPEAQAETSAAPAPAPEKAPRVRQHGEDQRIVVLVPANPKRANSKSHPRFALYQDGMTVKEYLDAVVALQGGSRTRWLADLKWDVKHGFIAVGDHPKDETPAEQEAPAEEETTKEAA